MRSLNIDIFVRAYIGEEKPAGIRLTLGTPVEAQGGQGVNMNLQLNVGQKVPYLVNEIDGNGNVVAPGAGDTCNVTADASGLVSLVPDTIVAPGAVASGYIVAGTPATGGTATISAQAMSADGSSIGLPSTVAVDVVVGAPVPAPAVGTVITLGVPVSQ